MGKPTQNLIIRHGRRALQVGCLCAAACFANNAASSLPDLGSSDLIEYTPQKEAELGRAFTAALHNEYDILDDADINEYVRRIGSRIAQQTGDPRHFSFYVINHPSINAFAGPNGVIGIHTGLIRAVRNEDELASVIAHEIAHVTQNHLSRRFEMQSGSSLTQIASLLAAILIGMHDSSAGMAALMGGMGAGMQQQLKFSRMHESEADSAGIDYLYQSGYDPFAMEDFFGRLALKYRNNEFKPLEILSTHPVTEHRLAEARSRATLYPPLVYKQDPQTLRLIKMRLQSLTRESSPVVVDAKEESPDRCYRQALNQLNDKPGRSNYSTTCLKQAIKAEPGQRLYQTLLLELALKHPAPKTSPDVLEQARISRDLFPQDSSVLMKTAQLLHQKGKTDEAVNLLEKEAPKHTHQLNLYKLLSRIYADKGELGFAYLSEAKAHLNIGQIKRTKIYLEKAESITSPSRELKKRIHDFTEKHRKLLNPNSKN